MKTTRRKFTSKFKTKVVLEALKERETIHQIAARYEIHPTQVNMWKRQFLDSAEGVFEGDVKPSVKSAEEDQEKLYKKIVRLQMEVDFLKKAWARTEHLPKTKDGKSRTQNHEYIRSV